MNKNGEAKDDDADPYGDSTDNDEPSAKKALSSDVTKMEVDDDDDNDSGLPELPDFFTDKNFFLYGDFSVSERRLLTRYITAYDGWVTRLPVVCVYIPNSIYPCFYAPFAEGSTWHIDFSMSIRSEFLYTISQQCLATYTIGTYYIRL